MRTLSKIATGVLIAGLLLFLPPSAAASSDDEPTRPRWSWVVDGPHDVTEGFRAPAHDFGPGHRGMDVAVPADGAVRAPADGVVAFRGTVVDRPLITLEHPGGYVSTFEPLDSSLSAGDRVAAGDVIGEVSAGGHAPTGALHIGVRLEGEYINPMLLFGEVPRAVLLPCCGAGGPEERTRVAAIRFAADG
ncbi:murein hydrolase activator EnvC [Streptomyces sp. AC495_CC817]|uniref:murein hydrolase activator EnvC family protein n=1 Tax=Streptomyces sp. AC495_CC817 TaxID=2823900 RepID=UPI001C25B692|nr:M23 family metallopeptidase [Streptomyces sp. AC495_CC817]